MTKRIKGPYTKKVWLIETLTQDGQSNKHTLVATCKKDCKSLIDELILDEPFTYVKLDYIGNIATSAEFWKDWDGESLILMTNYF